MRKYCMRSWVFASPQSERKLSTSSSSMRCLGDRSHRAVDAAAEDGRDLHGHLAVVLAGVAAVDERAHHHLQVAMPFCPGSL
jgi:hypothetical protein